MNRRLSRTEISSFRRAVYRYYATQGRHYLPWRHTADPYRIFVSEVMLQQTQVDRVVDKYDEFVGHFRSWRTLARAPLGEVLKCWQGLGYNRRGRFLHLSAQVVVRQYRGRLPDDPERLSELPGIGPATAASIAAFGFNRPTVFIETNIRSVFIHHFFAGTARPVDDAELLPLVAQTLDRRQPARWYSALMDYGVSLKKRFGNPSRRSRQHVRQSRFEGSQRQVRGAVLSALVNGRPATAAELERIVSDPEGRVRQVAAALCREGLVEKKGQTYRISG